MDEFATANWFIKILDKELKIMKTGVGILIVSLAFLPLCANATPIDIDIYNDTTISSGEYGTVNIYDTPPEQTTVTMTGGQVTDLYTYQSSMVNLVDGYIYGFYVTNSSMIDMLGGAIHHLMIGDSAIANLRGGQITYHISASGSSIFNIYGKEFYYIGDHLHGLWADNSSFDIWVRGPGTNEHVVLHEIPEPITILFLGLGYFLIKRRS